MEDLTALFHQYETDYCNKSTDISRKISSIASITGGVAWGTHTSIPCQAIMSKQGAVSQQLYLFIVPPC